MGEGFREEEQIDRSRAERLRYPERSMSECMDAVWRFVDRRLVSGITPTQFSDVTGLPKGSDRLRGLALALRSLGLVKPASDGLRLSRLAVELAQTKTGSSRYRRLLWEVVHLPELYSRLPARYQKFVPATDALVDYFVDNHALAPIHAREAAIRYRDALRYAGLMGDDDRRLVPELRVLPRYDPTDSELMAVPPMPLDEEYPTPPPLPSVRATPGPLPAFRPGPGDGHHLELELSPGRVVVLDLPSDITVDEIDRLVDLMRLLARPG